MAVAFDLVYVGYSDTRSLLVSNIGTDLLEVASVTSTSGDFSVVPTSFSLAPFESTTLTITFAPTEAGSRAGELIFESNDPDSPHVVMLSDPALLPPVAVTHPTELEAAALPGGTKVKTLRICNDGASPLEWSLAAAQDATAAVIYPAVELPKEVEDTRAGILGSGGPDAFGYTWVDSDDPGGPVFDWMDISGVGTPMFNGYSDDGNRGPVAIGFDFPFYGTTFNSLRVVSNGWLSFTSTSTAYTNQPLPSSGAPENLLAVYWDDMVVDPAQNGEVYVYDDGTRCIVQWNVRRIANTTAPFYEFQAILYPNGNIVYQYNSIGTINNSATIGIQNAARDDGLMVAFNTEYAMPGKAIRFSAAPEWLTAEPTAGTLQSGECVDVVVTFDASELEEGDYTGSIDIVSNDPANPVLTVPVLFHVGSIVAFGDVDPNTLNLRSNGRWITGYVVLPMGYDSRDIVLDTVTFMGVVPADVNVFSLDNDVDGAIGAMFKFDRIAIEPVLPEGEWVDVFVQGEVRDTTWFIATDRIRIIRPKLKALASGAAVLGGSTTIVSWTMPEAPDYVASDVVYSTDEGENWTVIATDVRGSQVEWAVPAITAETARVRVIAKGAEGTIGFATSEEPFAIVATPTSVDTPAQPRVYALNQKVVPR